MGRFFAVSSVRDYGDVELYFSTDALFGTLNDAEEYIRIDAERVSKEYSDLYGEEIHIEKMDGNTDEYTGCRILFDDHRFLWRIDTIDVDDNTIVIFKKEV